MNLILKASLALGSFPGLLAAAKVEWLEISAAPAAWQDALPAATPQRAALVLDSRGQTRLRGFLPATPLARASSEEEIRTRVAGFLTISPKPDDSDLKIDWLGNDGLVVDFTRSIHLEDGRVRSTHRVGMTTITRTVLASRADAAVFIHLIADQPGALSFRVSLAGEARIEDRRQLISPAGATRLGAHVWVLPFESDVASEGDSITVRGEGEALVVWSFAAGNAAADTWTRLGTRHDPGHVPPDPARIWRGVLASHLKSLENSP